MKRLLTWVVCTWLIVLLIATGCTPKTEPSSGSNNPSTNERIARLEQELQAAHKAITSLEEELEQLRSGVPPAIYRALAIHVFNEFRHGRPPLDLIEGDSFEFWVGIEEGQNRDPVSKEEIDFTPVLNWFDARPETQVESVEIWPGSKNDRVWMNLKSTDGFYVRVAFEAYRLRAFSISEKPIPWE